MPPQSRSEMSFPGRFVEDAAGYSVVKVFVIMSPQSSSEGRLSVKSPICVCRGRSFSFFNFRKLIKCLSVGREIEIAVALAEVINHISCLSLLFCHLLNAILEIGRSIDESYIMRLGHVAKTHTLVVRGIDAQSEAEKRKYARR